VRTAHALVADIYRTLNDEVLPAMAGAGIRLLRQAERNAAQRAWVADYFRREVKPLLSPIGLDPAHPFPQVVNKSLNFIVELSGSDAFGRETAIAIVKAPHQLPRVIESCPWRSPRPTALCCWPRSSTRIWANCSPDGASSAIRNFA
jgi:polyphosphate kinase